MRILMIAAVAALGLTFLTPAAHAGDPYRSHRHTPVRGGYGAPGYAPGYYGRGFDRYDSPCDHHGRGYIPGPAFYPPARPVVIVPPPARPVIVVPPPRPIVVPAPRPVPYGRSGFSFSLNIFK